ncbi:MAG: signal peptide peptidase SppA [Bacteroidales bacterium]|nr:signal peptide peptidase SppA [Bacteroidales bacterium]
MKAFVKVFFGSLLGCLAAIAVFVVVSVVFVCSLGAAFAIAGSGGPVNGSVLRIDAASPILERDVTDISLRTLSVNTGATPLYHAIKAIEEASADPAIKYIYLDATDLELSLSATEELRGALEDFRASGKPVVAYSNSYSQAGYWLASVADKVIANPYGENLFIGMSTSSYFLKDLLDRLGIDVQLIRHGKYKSAGEIYTCNRMSDDNRRQTQEMVEGLWNTVASGICSSRGVSEEEFDGWIDNLEISRPENLVEKGLVDTLFHIDEMKQYLTSLAGAKSYDKIGFVSLADYAGARVCMPEAKSKVAVIYAFGEIVMGSNKDTQIDGLRLAAEIEKVRADSSVKAVVLRVNSPGGRVDAAQIIRQEVLALQEIKPVVASYGDYAASGGYWISSSANKIFCDATALTGSIGVFSLVPSFGGAISKKLNVNVESVGSNLHSDMQSGMRPLNEAELLCMQGSVEKIYDEFVGLVAEGRGMSPDAVDEIAQGRVWCGSDALKIGLVDETGGIVDAVRYAAAMAGLEPGEYGVAEYPATKTPYEKILEALTTTTSIKALFAKKTVTDSEQILLDGVESAFAPFRNASHGEIMARMPYVYSIR